MMPSELQALEQPAAEILARYDQKKAAMLPLLHLVQERFGHIPPKGSSGSARNSASPSPMSARS